MSDLPEVRRARPFVSLVILCTLGAINVCLFLFIAPKFQQIYVDSLPGSPLPGLTQFIFGGRLLLAFLAVAWPVAALVTLFMRYRYTGWVVVVGLWFFMAMIPVTLFGLLSPLDSSHGGMADSSSTASHDPGR